MGLAPDVRLNKADLGNTRIDQVSSGVTFTSSNGVKITWIYTCMMPNNILIVNNESVPLNGKCYNKESLIHWEDGVVGQVLYICQIVLILIVSDMNIMLMNVLIFLKAWITVIKV